MAKTAPDVLSPEPLPRVIVLATGGTIAGRADPRSAVGYNAGGVTGEQLVASVPGLDRLAALDVEQIANVASQDMSEAIWLALAARIRRIIDWDEADGIVITHGTDTLEETAFFLHLTLPASKPVALTGAMRPSDAPDADGPANLRAAVQAAASPQSQGRGVLVVMGSDIYDPRRIVKTHTTAVQAFESPETGPVGAVDPATIRYFAPAPAARRAPLAIPQTVPLPRVAIVYAYAGMDAAPITHAVQNGARGIVLAGLGNGNAPQVVLTALNRATRQGVAVVRATRVPAGEVNRNVEVDDDASGFVAAGGLNPQKARVLLQLLLSNGVTAPAALQRAFDEV
ncbi:MAG: asparaginase [Burkholderiaceae bacterium]|jgi:L-asparaginase|nr:asparaginase [Burkholderiaceae bacterium]